MLMNYNENTASLRVDFEKSYREVFDLWAVCSSGVLVTEFFSEFDSN